MPAPPYLQAEIERLRRQAAEREAKQYAEQRKAATEVAAAAAASAASAATSQEVPQDLREKLSRTLKVSWNRKVGWRLGSEREETRVVGTLAGSIVWACLLPCAPLGC